MEGERLDKPIAWFQSLYLPKRVIVFRRETGTYYFEHQHFSDEEYENCWIPYPQSMTSFYETLTSAMLEALSRVDCLAVETGLGAE